jgi:CTP:molybdopterin cytidylyltransferase MocA
MTTWHKVTLGGTRYSLATFADLGMSAASYKKLHGNMAAAQIPAQRVCWADDTYVMLDLAGGKTLLDACRACRPTGHTKDLYDQAILGVVQFQQMFALKDLGMEEKHNIERLLVNRWRSVIDRSTHDEMLSFVEKVCGVVYQLSRERMPVCHRAFTHRNIGVNTVTHEICLLNCHLYTRDAQHFDIASLVFDCEFFVPMPVRNELVNRYLAYNRCAVPAVHRSEILATSIAVFGHILASGTATADMLRCMARYLAEIGEDDNLLDDTLRPGFGNLSEYVSAATDRLSASGRLAAITLCAGKGTRMGGAHGTPKCAVRLCGAPMITYVQRALHSVSCFDQCMIVGYEKEKMAHAVRSHEGGVLVDSERGRDCGNSTQIIEQAEQRGTGHAVQQATPFLESSGADDVIVAMGDMPVLNYRVLSKMIAAHRGSGAVSTVATIVQADPGTNARIVRDAAGALSRIVEFRDIIVGDAATRQITEVNMGLYIFRKAELLEYLPMLDCDNAQNEFYLPDVVRHQMAAGLPVSVFAADGLVATPIGANTPGELALIETALSRRG